MSTIKYLFFSTTTVALSLIAQQAHAFTLFSDRMGFHNELGTFIVDDYSNPGYLAGDRIDTPTSDLHSDASMSAVIGETQYTTTGISNHNKITNQTTGEFVYCAGCNNSYLLDFTSTSVGDSSGVFGVGLDIFDGQNVFGTYAFVTFGNGSTENFLLPDVNAFWGITSDLSIASIHFGLEDGGTNTSNSVQRMAMDNLTIGSKATSTPEPSALLGLGTLALAGGTLLRRRWKVQGQNDLADRHIPQPSVPGKVRH